MGEQITLFDILENEETAPILSYGKSKDYYDISNTDIFSTNDPTSERKLKWKTPAIVNEQLDIPSNIDCEIYDSSDQKIEGEFTIVKSIHTNISNRKLIIHTNSDLDTTINWEKISKVKINDSDNTIIEKKYLEFLSVGTKAETTAVLNSKANINPTINPDKCPSQDIFSFTGKMYQSIPP